MGSLLLLRPFTIVEHAQLWMERCTFWECREFIHVYHIEITIDIARTNDNRTNSYTADRLPVDFRKTGWYNTPVMKANIHPAYNAITVSCSCGNTFQTGSTKSSVTVDICSKCHPFFTGEMRFVDTMGRVEKYQAKQKAAVGKKKKKDRKSDQTSPQTLSDIRAAAK